MWKLDRLGRSMVETIKTIQELMTLKGRIVVTTQGLT
ncbi:MAG: recombinase family protein, partial [Planctomycetes bacterium]|nr:recombinase family protein [Planctomycetota bacterium]